MSKVKLFICIIIILMSAINATNIQRGNNDFAIKLYKILSKANENILFSPLSVHAVLTLCYQGSAGTTHEILQDILQLPPDPIESANEYEIILNSYNQSVEVVIANNIFANIRYPLKPTYRLVAKESFLTNIQNVDFELSTSAAREINEWVLETTHSKIQNVVSESDLSEDTRLVLINAIYFKSSWLNMFNLDQTQTDKFYISDTYSVDCEMMRAVGRFPYSENQELDVRILKIPYVNNFYFLIILPNTVNGIEVLEKRFSDIDVAELMKDLGTKQVEVFLPKFKLETSIDLKKPLEEMGLWNIFSDQADFSQMLNSQEQLKVSKVLQKSFLDVNENGTEAAAATAAVIRTRRSASPDEYTFRADKPFLFYILDVNSMIVFMGKLFRPNAVVKHDEL